MIAKVECGIWTAWPWAVFDANSKVWSPWMTWKDALSWVAIAVMMAGLVGVMLCVGDFR